ncbi:MAG: penicillin-binding protein 2 [Spirochaetia bacterium]
MFTTMNSTRFLMKRIHLVISLMALIIGAFVLKLFNLQIIKGSLYQNQAKRVSEHVVTVPSQRGLIFDRNGQLLAGNIELFSLQLIPAEIIEKEEIAPLLRKIAGILDLSPAVFERKIPQNLYYSRAPIELTKDVPLDKITYFSTKIDDFPGLYWTTRAKRNYLINENGKTVNHVIGYIGDITSEELQILYNQGYTSNDSIGKIGVEHYADRILRGRSGQRSVRVDAVGRRLGEKEEAFVTPINGKNIELTIDMKIQRLAEEALGNRRGSVVVLKPASGEILAMVSYPVFNANTFGARGSQGFASQAIDGNFPFINRTISAEYPPASTFKMAIAAAVLESGRVSPFHEVHCSGSIVLGNMRFRCHARAGHGWQNLNSAVANSCNVYFWDVMRNYVAFDANGKPGIEPITNAAKEFGYGLATGIDLTGEKVGLIPTREWKEETYHASWSGGDTLNMVIGQGFVLSTVLQAANAMAIVPNEGVIYRPHVIRATIDPLTGERSETTREVLHRSSFKKDTWQKLQRYARSTVLNGTGWMLNRIVPVAGKTGTAETGIDRSYHDWFTAYAPYNATNPNDMVVVAVMLEAHEEYAWWSTKIADMIFQGIFADQNYAEVLRTLQPWYINWRATPELTPPPDVIIPSRIIGTQE